MSQSVTRTFHNLIDIQIPDTSIKLYQLENLKKEIEKFITYEPELNQLMRHLEEVIAVVVGYRLEGK